MTERLSLLKGIEMKEIIGRGGLIKRPLLPSEEMGCCGIGLVLPPMQKTSGKEITINIITPAPGAYEMAEKAIKESMRKLVADLMKRPYPMPREMKPAAWKLRGKI